MAAHSPGASQAITGTVNEEAQQLLADLADYLQQHSAQPPGPACRSTTRISCRTPGLVPVMALAERAGLQDLVA